MRTLGNVLWHFPCFGFLSALYSFILGVVFYITVIGAPIGLGLMEYAKFLLAPFSQAMVSKADLGQEATQAWKVLSVIAFILYLPFGLIACLVSAVQIAFLFISIVGIPVALVLAKSLHVCLNPINKKCVPQAVADELERRKAQAIVAQHLKS